MSYTVKNYKARARLHKSGRVEFLDSSDQWRLAHLFLEDGAEHTDVFVQVTRVRDDASDKQRGYYFGVLVYGVAEAMRETGNYSIDPGDKKDLEEVHRFLTNMFASPSTAVFDVKGEQVEGTKSIRRHDTGEQEEYHAKIRAWAYEMFGVSLPLPNE